MDAAELCVQGSIFLYAPAAARIRFQSFARSFLKEGDFMKRIYVNEKWCLGCHLCEYECAFANSGLDDIVKALKGKPVYPRVTVEDCGEVHFAVNCRHCSDAVCVRSCISGALSKGDDGVVRIDREKCVGCLTCVLVCPYGAVMPAPDGHAAMKCQLCTDNGFGEPNCVKHCPNNAIVFEERAEVRA